ncbi:glycosyltransferase [Erythrobacter sp. THAF29]|uniref:glycosyltransferase n=1 Tax=Erythrobacter sp. THAF29 TaxID=2587851 RepID=UPI00126855C0|nr:glycosyltransferase [Erythrobacter sp. THAF29]QFT77386.1 Putative teichuronic acid biosynthesis glycosyltransferase TuaC [Erythrobacter sp. THAF29]
MKHVVSISTLYPNAANPRFGTFVARSLEALARRGDWRVTVINPIGMPPVAVGRYRALSELDELAEEQGVTVHRPRFTLIPKVGARRNAMAIAKAVIPLAKRIHAENPVDLIDAQFFFPDGPAAAMVAETLDLPLTIKARGSDITHWGSHDHARAQMLEAANAATGLLAVSEALKADMTALGMPEEKITVHYTGLDRDRFRPLDHTQLRSQVGQALSFDLPDNAPMLVSVGALIERKGQAHVIAALPSIPGARLVLVGKGEDEAKLRALASECGVSDRVHFTGAIDHDLLPLILSAADVMVLPTSNEGLANAWVEALACGTPVVTSDVGGAREIITDDVAGRLLEEPSAEAVAAAVNTVLNAPPDRMEVAARAEPFDWETHAEALAAHFEKLTRG